MPVFTDRKIAIELFGDLWSKMVFEELAWGSFGLALLTTVVCFPFYLICITNEEHLIEQFVVPFCNCTDGSIRGCWGITEPGYGSDHVNMGEDFFSSPKLKGDVRAKLDGDEYVINGQKSAWVSGGTIATHTMLHVQLEPSKGFAGNDICILPLDLPGVSKGKPLEKLGQRDLNQGEFFFDDVRIPTEWMFVDPDFYVPMMDMILNAANLSMASWSVGLSRAAFDEKHFHMPGSVSRAENQSSNISPPSSDCSRCSPAWRPPVPM